MSCVPSNNDIANYRRELAEKERLYGQREKQLHARYLVGEQIKSIAETLSRLKRTYPLGHPSIDSQTQTLNQLKQQNRELDRWLDLLEDVTSESLQADRQRLTQWVLEEEPAKREPWEQLQAQRQQLVSSTQLLNALVTTSLDLVRFLTRAIEEGNSMRRGGVLRYIAGLNPNLVITTCLTGIGNTATQLIRNLQNAKGQLPEELYPPSAYEAFTILLSRCQHKSQAKWRWRTLSQELHIEQQQLQESINLLTLAQKKALHQLSDVEKDLDAWLFDTTTNKN